MIIKHVLFILKKNTNLIKFLNFLLNKASPPQSHSLSVKKISVLYYFIYIKQPQI